jgi:hypothetical protein
MLMNYQRDVMKGESCLIENGNKNLQLNLINTPSLSSVVTKKSYTIGVNTTNHGQNTNQVNAGNNTQKGKTSRETLVNLEVQTGNQ